MLYSEDQGYGQFSASASAYLTQGMVRAILFYSQGIDLCSASARNPISTVSFVRVVSSDSFSRSKLTQGQDAWCCRNIDRLKCNTLLMVLDHALAMVIVYKSSSVMCPLVGVLARDAESKRKAHEVIAQCVSYGSSNIDRQML